MISHDQDQHDETVSLGFWHSVMHAYASYAALCYFGVELGGEGEERRIPSAQNQKVISSPPPEKINGSE